jgi:putative inorganic carbon (HCO3(-)) transporter
MLNPGEPFLYLLTYLFLLYIRPQEYITWLSGVPILPFFLAVATLLWANKQKKDYYASSFRVLLWQFFLMFWSLMVNKLFTDAFQLIGDFLPVVLLFFMLATCADTIERMRAIFTLISTVMVIISVHCIDESIKGVGWTGAVPLEGRVTYLGFLSDPNDLSMAILMAMPMLFYLLFRAGWFMRLVWLAGFVAMMYTVILANSRGAVLALGAQILQYSFRRYGWKKSLIVAPLLLAPMILFGPSRMSEMSADEESAEGRVDAWEAGFRMFFTHPLFGVGKGQFTDYHRITAHNSYMLVLAELGAIGLCVWLSNLALAVAMSRTAGAAHLPPPPPKVEPEQAPNPFRLPIKKTQASPADEWPEIQAQSRAIYYGWVGALTAMFFLSRSYITIIYVQIALTVASYQMARRCNPNVPGIQWKPHAGKFVMMAIVAIIFLFGVTKKLQ